MPKSQFKEILSIVGAAAIVIILLSAVPVGLKYFRGSDPQAAKVDVLIRSAGAGNWEQAYLCTTEEFRRAVSQEQLRRALQFQPGFQQGGTHKLDSFNYTSTRAGTVNAVVNNPDGSTATFRFVLYLPVTGMDFLIDDIELNGKSLFAK